MQGSMDISNLAYCSSEGKRLGNTDLTDVVIDAKIVKIIYARHIIQQNQWGLKSRYDYEISTDISGNT